MLELVDQATNTSSSPLPAERAEDLRARMDLRLFARRDAGDPRARNELIERFLPLAHSLARRYERRGEPLEDLVQVASLALVKAIDGYDSARGIAFSSYAVPTIVGELKRYFRDRTWTVRPPRGVQELTLRVDRAAENLSAELDRAPTVAELAAALDATDEDVLEALQARGAYRGLSMHAPTGGQENPTLLQDTLGTSDDGYARVEARVLLDGLLVGLSPRSREVLRLRFEHDLTQAEIGAQLGVSQMQISRIIHRAINHLRHVAEHQQRLAEDQLTG
jgi:RNA polymerase sigma-B factor